MMDACKKIHFHTPAQIAGYIAGFVGIWVTMLIVCIICI